MNVLRPIYLGTLIFLFVSLEAASDDISAPAPQISDRSAHAPPRRPQTPAPPFPYVAEEIAYQNRQHPGVHLAGTLTKPRSSGRVPAVVLISGSGAQDRDETSLQHKPFLVLADYLTRRGVAVLRVDDRGVGGSSGARRDDTSEDYATDVAAGVAFLRTHADIDPDAIGLIGHSEGALIAALVASKDPSIACLVFLAGPGVPGRDIIAAQARAHALAAGASPDVAEVAARDQGAILDAAMSAGDLASIKVAVQQTIEMRGLTAPQPGMISALSSAWYRFYIAYDPRPTLRSIRAPVLALLGSKDMQVLADQNASALREALADNPRADVRVLDGLNHAFQTAQTGRPEEYALIEETIAPAALASVGDWLADQFCGSSAERACGVDAAR